MKTAAFILLVFFLTRGLQGEPVAAHAFAFMIIQQVNAADTLKFDLRYSDVTAFAAEIGRLAAPEEMGLLVREPDIW
jgi:hypothetical protein